MSNKVSLTMEDLSRLRPLVEDSRVNAWYGIALEWMSEASEEIFSLRASLESAQKCLLERDCDAERYRKVRDGNPDEGPYIVVHRQNSWGNWFHEHFSGVGADMVIDACPEPRKDTWTQAQREALLAVLKEICEGNDPKRGGG